MIKVLEAPAVDTIISYEKKKLESNGKDPMDNELFSWEAPWRKESLDHYLPMGWSFCLWEDGEYSSLKGYFIAQPLVFYSGWTQSLWVEHVSFNNAEIGHELLDLAYRTARSKHFQKMFIQNLDPSIKLLDKWKPKKISDNVTEFTTAKITEK